MSPIEILAAIISLVGIVLAAKGKVLNWPISIVGIILTAFVAYEAKLGGQVVLQAVYFISSLYGWWHWRRHAHAGQVSFDKAPLWEIGLAFAVAVGVSFGLRPALAGFTPAERLPADAAITAFSLLAQFWLTRRRIENWTVWIAVDVWSAVLFWQSGQMWIAGQFAVLVGVASWGLWRHIKSEAGFSGFRD